MYKKILLVTLAIATLSTSAIAQHRPPSPRSRPDNNELAEKKRELKELEEEISRKKREENQKLAKSYGSNFVRLSPFKFLDLDGVGFSLEYERLFGENKMFGVVLPVTVMLQINQFTDWNTPNATTETKYNPYVYFTPGFKIYPTGQRRVTYAIGPSFMLGFGKPKEWQMVSTPTNSYWQMKERSNTRLGLLIMNYVNFQFVKNFSMGIDAGVGARYWSKFSNPNETQTIVPTGQFSVNFGYRF